MKVSINHIRYYQEKYDWSADPMPVGGIAVLAQKIGAQLGAIEEIIDFGAKYKGALIVKVVSCEQHPNADRLHVCLVDDGGKAEGVERDGQGLVQVVCGAPNVYAGMLAVWLPPGTTVPSTFEKDPFVLEARDIRGQTSNGMLASPKELGLGDYHEGILEIDEDITSGTSFADKYELSDDYILDIENKMFTHRPDCFGMMGVAREIAGIQGQAFKSPDWYRLQPDFPAAEASELKLEVRNELPELVPRFAALTMSGVKVKSSPVWLQVRLSRLGLRPINNVVDLTNYYMLLTGQPLHAYDYDKVKAQDEGADRATLAARYPKPGEKITLLNGKTVEPRPRPETVTIATRDRVIGIGGVMGGGDTEVDDSTKNIILECANFDMYSIRRTSMALGLFTDAVTRFNKGQSPLQNPAVLWKITEDIRELTGGKVSSAVIDDNHLPKEMLERASVHPPATVTPEFINTRLGLTLSVNEMSRLLENVEFSVMRENGSLTVTAPFWRTDVEIPEDIVEEVGRLYGYDKLPLDLPRRDLAPAPKDPPLELKSRIRKLLSRAGANEVLTYSFVHGNLLDKVGQDRAQAYQLANALSPDLQYYRLSLIPSLLEKVHPNSKAGYDEFALFELGKAHNKSEHDDDGLPREVGGLGFVFAAGNKAAAARYAGAAYFQARCYLDMLLKDFAVVWPLKFEPLAGADLYNNPWIMQMSGPFEPNRSAVLRDGDDLIWGVIGEFKSAVKKALKLPDFCAGFELDPLLFTQPQSGQRYTSLPRFPKVEQDICLKVAADMPYRQLFDFVSRQLAELPQHSTLASLSPVDIYQRPDDLPHKQITLRLSIASYERTLTDSEVARILDKIASVAAEELGAERI
jgi:phenylalanyl-tRNA synthetase beta chain